jgi:serine phosphatase RsbU (regulator of sigma subunit)
MTSFRDACAQPGLSLPEVARVVDRSVTRAAGDEDFVTAVFAELDPRGWLQLVICGHPPPLRLTAGGGLQALTPRAYATPLGLHPDLQASTFTVSPGDRLVFYTDGLLEARDRAGRYFRLEDCAGTLRHPDLQAATDGLLGQLLAHTSHKLDDDVALLLLEATSPVPGGPRPPHDRGEASASPAGRSLAGTGRPARIGAP